MGHSGGCTDGCNYAGVTGLTYVVSPGISAWAELTPPHDGIPRDTILNACRSQNFVVNPLDEAMAPALNFCATSLPPRAD